MPTLMTPTATVCLMSRTAKRPRGGNSWKLSTHMGLEGTRVTIAASPDLMDLGSCSVVFPENQIDKSEWLTLSKK